MSTEAYKALKEILFELQWGLIGLSANKPELLKDSTLQSRIAALLKFCDNPTSEGKLVLKDRINSILTDLSPIAQAIQEKNNTIMYPIKGQTEVLDSILTNILKFKFGWLVINEQLRQDSVRLASPVRDVSVSRQQNGLKSALKGSNSPRGSMPKKSVSFSSDVKKDDDKIPVRQKQKNQTNETLLHPDYLDNTLNVTRQEFLAGIQKPEEHNRLAVKMLTALALTRLSMGDLMKYQEKLPSRRLNFLIDFFCSCIKDESRYNNFLSNPRIPLCYKNELKSIFTNNRLSTLSTENLLGFNLPQNGADFNFSQMTSALQSLALKNIALEDLSPHKKDNIFLNRGGRLAKFIYAITQYYSDFTQLEEFISSPAISYENKFFMIKLYLECSTEKLDGKKSEVIRNFATNKEDHELLQNLVKAKSTPHINPSLSQNDYSLYGSSNKRKEPEGDRYVPPSLGDEQKPGPFGKW